MRCHFADVAPGRGLGEIEHLKPLAGREQRPENVNSKELFKIVLTNNSIYGGKLNINDPHNDNSILNDL